MHVGDRTALQPFVHQATGGARSNGNIAGQHCATSECAVTVYIVRRDAANCTTNGDADADGCLSEW
jgi:hypothetical protein